MDNNKSGVTFQARDHTKARLTVTEPHDIEAMRRDGNWFEVKEGSDVIPKVEERPEWMFPIQLHSPHSQPARKRGRPSGKGR